MKTLNGFWKNQNATILGIAAILIPVIMQISDWIICNWKPVLFCIGLFLIGVGIIKNVIRKVNKEEIKNGVVELNNKIDEIKNNFSDLQATFTDVTIINSINTLLIRDIILEHIGYNDDLIKALIDKDFTTMDLDRLGNEINAEFKRKFYIQAKEMEIEKLKISLKG